MAFRCLEGWSPLERWGSPDSVAECPRLGSRMWLAGTGLFECEQVERERRYHRPLYLAAAGAIALNLGVLALLTFSVLGDHVYAATSDWAWWARVLAFTLLVLSLTALVGLPIAFWAGSLRGWEAVIP